MFLSTESCLNEKLAPPIVSRKDESELMSMDLNNEHGATSRSSVNSAREKGNHKVKFAVENNNSRYLSRRSSLHVDNKVIVQGLSRDRQVIGVMKLVTFTVDLSRTAQMGELGLCIEGKAKADIYSKEISKGCYKIHFQLPKAGLYMIHVSFADSPIPESPFKVEAVGEDRVAQSTKIECDILDTKQTNAMRLVGKICEIRIPLTKSFNTLDIEAYAETPSGSNILCSVQVKEDGECELSFTPVECGIHSLSVHYRGLPIPESPFLLDIKPNSSNESLKVVASGKGLIRGISQVNNQFTIDASEAGRGKISISLIGPDKGDLYFQDNESSGMLLVNYSVREEGFYTCQIQFNEENITGSPYSIFIQSNHDAFKQQLTTNSDVSSVFNTGIVGQNVIIELNIPQNIPFEEICANVVHEEDQMQLNYKLQPIRTGRVAIQFLPQQTGRYIIHLRRRDPDHSILSGPHYVTIRNAGDLECVSHTFGTIYATGDALERGFTNERNTFHISIPSSERDSSLKVAIDGPSQVKVDAQEENHFIRVTYLPIVEGKYLISIRHGVESRHIRGSPFKTWVTSRENTTSFQDRPSFTPNEYVDPFVTVSTAAQPCPERVLCSGIGLKKASIGCKNEFLVDASEAGKHVLRVGIIGPRGKNKSVRVKHLVLQKYRVKYFVTDIGTHVLVVKWGDEHVPGSPYMLEVS